MKNLYIALGVILLMLSLIIVLPFALYDVLTGKNDDEIPQPLQEVV